MSVCKLTTHSHGWAAFRVLEWLIQPDFADQFGASVESVPTTSYQRYNFTVATIQIKQVPPDIHRRLRIRAAAAGQSLQRYVLDAVCKQADLASAEELLARKRAEALAFGESDIDPELIVEIIRADRDSR